MSLRAQVETFLRLLEKRLDAAGEAIEQCRGKLETKVLAAAKSGQAYADLRKTVYSVERDISIAESRASFLDEIVGEVSEILEEEGNE